MITVHITYDNRQEFFCVQNVMIVDREQETVKRAWLTYEDGTKSELDDGDFVRVYFEGGLRFSFMVRKNV